MTTGFVFTVSIDFLLSGAFLVWTENVVRLNTYNPNLCFFECHLPELLVTWSTSTFFFFLIHSSQAGTLGTCYQRWFARYRNLGSRYNRPNHGYQAVSTAPPAGEAAGSKGQKQRTFTYTDQLEFNFFDPDSVPLALQPFSDVIFSEVQRIGAQYGFQVDNSRNQAEHLLMILTNEMSKFDYGNLKKPVMRVHNKLFYNYKKWCGHVGVRALTFDYLNKINRVYVPAPSSSAPEHDELHAFAPFLCDLLLWLLIWGEAGNLKHMPESLCYLFHQTLVESRHFAALRDSHEMYPGFYLDMTITPLYDVIASALLAKGDHNEKKTYDDLNEFFWSPDCLNYRITDATLLTAALGASVDERDAGGVNARTSRINNYGQFTIADTQLAQEHISAGLSRSGKTYVEKRSWLHPLLNLHRVFEWHVITFTILATWAFSNQLVWNLAYTTKVMSFVFWEISTDT